MPEKKKKKNEHPQHFILMTILITRYDLFYLIFLFYFFHFWFSVFFFMQNIFRFFHMALN